MLTPAICSPPPNHFPFVTDDPSVAVWRISLACAVVLGAETLLMLWRVQTLRSASLPLAGVLGCLALVIASWVQSPAFTRDVCAPSLNITPEMRQRLVERAQAALQTDMVYQDLTVAACVVTLVLLVWGVFRLTLLPRQHRAA